MNNSKFVGVAILIQDVHRFEAETNKIIYSVAERVEKQLQGVAHVIPYTLRGPRHETRQYFIVLALRIDATDGHLIESPYFVEQAWALKALLYGEMVKIVGPALQQLDAFWDIDLPHEFKEPVGDRSGRLTDFR